MTVAAVVIGRNEGERLVRCLAALKDSAHPIIYVDSASNDGSPGAARSTGAEVVELDMTRPFTAARARNAGLDRLKQGQAPFVQLVDGDCEIKEGWLETAAAFLADNTNVAAVTGRLRERHPEASLWNGLADAEWQIPVGDIEAVGGIAMVRRDALAEVGGFRDDLIAGEEPELCLRLRRAGWQIWSLDAEMAWHDAAMTRFGQWWRRTRRGGFAFAAAADLHGAGPERFRIRETRRALFWGLAIPGVAFLGLILTPWSPLLLLAWPLQVMRLVAKGTALRRSFFLTLGKSAEALGVLEYHMQRLTGRRKKLIEYK